MKAITKKKPFNVVATVTIVLLVLYAISMFIPIFWTVMTTLKTRFEYESLGNALWLPKEGITFENFTLAYEYFKIDVTKGPVGRTETIEFYIFDQFVNSILYSCGCAFGITLSSLVMGYATARFSYRFSNVIYSFVLVTLALPIVGSLPSEIAVSRGLRIFDTFPGIWIMRANFLNTYFLIFYAQFKMIPRDYTEAAKIDGASPLTIMTKIIVPLAMGTVTTVFVLNFIGYWNDFQIPMVYLPSHPVAAYGMYRFQEDRIEKIDYTSARLAGICIMALPIIVFYGIFNRKLNVNMSVGGIKG